MKDVMLDIETLGKGNNALILSIGACFFDRNTGAIGATFHEFICTDSSESFGLKIDASTVLWWLTQDYDARKAITDGQQRALPLPVVMHKLDSFINRGVRVWGNGATFDNTIVKNACKACDVNDPWEFWNDRDVRTIVDLGKDVGFDPKKDMPFDGVKHDALADAIHQAKYTAAIYQRLTK